ncbi:hypothetical protein Lal_00017014, partial [Lupinus albus]
MSAMIYYPQWAGAESEQKQKPAKEATWGKGCTIRSQFPAFSLEDKTGIRGGGSDRPYHEDPSPKGQLLDQLSYGTKMRK